MTGMLSKSRTAKPFNSSIKEELSDLLQRTKAFRVDEQLSRQFSLACVVQDRLLDAIRYLDSHLDPPRNNEELYLFMVYADNVFSAIKEFFKIPIIQNNVPYKFDHRGEDANQTTFFLDAFRKAFPKATSSEWPSDDDFFRYFRSLSFAHPYETSRQKFIDRDGGERHYSPFPITRNSPGFPIEEDGDVGVVVYSNGKGNSISSTYFSITLRYSTIKNFLISRYNTLADITKYIKHLLATKEKSWLRHKIDRNKPLPELLAQLHSIHEERLEEPYFIEELVRHIETPITSGCAKNEEVVGKYRVALKSILPLVCDAVDKGDYNTAAQIIDSIISAEIPDWVECPDNGYRGLNYYYGNVVVACADGNDTWKCRMAVDLDIVMKGYAAKWVNIDPVVMTNGEIIILLAAARWMESEECRRRGMFPRMQTRRIDLVYGYDSCRETQPVDGEDLRQRSFAGDSCA